MTAATGSPFDVVRRMGRFVSGVTGADRYERYVEHLGRVHPDRSVPSRADFWREHYARQERNPGTRCC
ncbi:YbdD/YjiX family protein [Janibacter hoylei]|uniref:YbdD/YjiX family protein n=1 Tax=Janibacter hoylei TaxID=364298 RepID=UPI0027B9B692|nr:YbdD/YjiX family protein [Janibacter hoylei]